MPQHNEFVAKSTSDLNDMGKPKKKFSVSKRTIKKFLQNKKKSPVPSSVEKKITDNTEPETPKASRVLTKVSKHFNLKGTEKGITVLDADDEKIQEDVEDMKKKYDKIKNNSETMESLKKESSLLASAQNALSEIKEEPTKEELGKKLKERENKEGEANKVLQKIRDLNFIDSLGNIKENNIQDKIEENHEDQSAHIGEELSLLDKFKKLTESIPSNKIKLKDKDEKETTKEEVLEDADKKEEEKKDEKEEKRKKHWWERTFFHNNKEDDKNNTVVNSENPPSGMKKIMMDLNSGENQFFAYYCFISITIFTITFFAAYNNKEIYDANENLMKHVKAFYIFGLVILILFLLSLSISFGHDKDIKQKITSFILLNGSIYMGTYYTYLQSNGSLQGLTSNQQMISEMIVAVFILFLLASVAYVLFEKRKGKIGRIFGILYLLTCVGGFFPLGAAATYFNSKLKIPKDQKESLFVPVCTAFFAVGIFLFISVVIDAIPPLNKVFSSMFNTIFKVLEPVQVKYLIIAGLTMSIYYTYIFYKAYPSKYISGDPSDPKKFPNKSKKGVFKLLKPLYEIGAALIALIVFSLALSFGGTIKQRLSAIFLTFFVVICGLFMVYLQGENKIEELSKEENTMTIATIAVFIILIIGCIFWTVFSKKTGKGVVIQDTIKIVSNFGAIALFFVMFGIGTAVSFTEFVGKYAGSWPGTTLWVGFGISLFIILSLIGSFFI
tara:strand:- start:47946 stop:50123 length:2178 start_codon:yes stop_codon:yes gene_type:complete